MNPLEEIKQLGREIRARQAEVERRRSEIERLRRLNEDAMEAIIQAQKKALGLASEGRLQSDAVHLALSAATPEEVVAGSLSLADRIVSFLQQRADQVDYRTIAHYLNASQETVRTTAYRLAKEGRIKRSETHRGFYRAEQRIRAMESQ